MLVVTLIGLPMGTATGLWSASAAILLPSDGSPAPGVTSGSEPQARPRAANMASPTTKDFLRTTELRYRTGDIWTGRAAGPQSRTRPPPHCTGSWVTHRVPVVRGMSILRPGSLDAGDLR